MNNINREEVIRELISRTVQEMRREKYLKLLADHWPLDENILDDSRKHLSKIEIDEIDSSSIEYLKSTRIPSIEDEYKGVTNLYIEFSLSRFDINVKVIGESAKLYECNCCGYLSLNSIEYDICDVCGWESDMTSDLGEYSSPNHSTLLEARMKYITHGHLYKKHISVPFFLAIPS